MKKQKIEKIMKILKEKYKKSNYPTVRRTSQTKDAFKTLIACLLSLRTQDKNTEKAAENLFRVADTPQKILKLPIRKLEKLIYSSGYYKKKARTIKYVSKVILEKYKGKVPDNKKELLSIKGIGNKTANIVLSFVYGKDVIPVDTHVHKVSNRIGLVKTKTPEQTERELMKVIPKKYRREVNTLFILFGKEICQSRKPKCYICPIKKFCKFKPKTKNKKLHNYK